MSASPELSIIIPAYNEASRLGPTLDRVLGWLSEQDRDAEVIVVDDGSKDATTNLVRTRARDEPRLRLVENGVNRGKGYTVGHGVREARGQRILFSDADLSTPIEELLKLEARLTTAEVVIGSRALPDSDLKVRQPFYRETMGRTFNLLVRLATGLPIHDTQCGFKLFTRQAALDTFGRQKLDGFAFDVEILYLAKRLGYRIAEVPVVWLHCEASRVSPIRDAARMFADIARVRFLHREL